MVLHIVPLLHALLPVLSACAPARENAHRSWLPGSRREPTLGPDKSSSSPLVAQRSLVNLASENEDSHCDPTQGSWVQDQIGASSPGVSSWDWMPQDNCSIIKFTGGRLCNAMEKLGLTNILIVGDSFSRTAFQSMVQLTSNDTKQRDEMDMFAGKHIVPCRQGSIGLQYIRNDFLDDTSDQKCRGLNSMGQHYFCAWRSKYKEVARTTLLVANMGLHFAQFSSYKNRFDDFMKFLYSVAPLKPTIIFRSIAPGHENCQNHQKPLASVDDFIFDSSTATHSDKGKTGYLLLLYNDYSLKTITKARLDKMAITFLDVYPMTVMRPDGHKPGDCLHFLAHGVPDWWNHLLMTDLMLKASAASKDVEHDAGAGQYFRSDATANFGKVALSFSNPNHTKTRDAEQKFEEVIPSTKTDAKMNVMASDSRTSPSVATTELGEDTAKQPPETVSSNSKNEAKRDVVANGSPPSVVSKEGGQKESNAKQPLEKPFPSTKNEAKTKVISSDLKPTKKHEDAKQQPKKTTTSTKKEAKTRTVASDSKASPSVTTMEHQEEDNATLSFEIPPGKPLEVSNDSMVPPISDRHPQENNTVKNPFIHKSRGEKKAEGSVVSEDAEAIPAPKERAKEKAGAKHHGSRPNKHAEPSSTASKGIEEFIAGIKSQTDGVQTEKVTSPPEDNVASQTASNHPEGAPSAKSQQEKTIAKPASEKNAPSSSHSNKEAGSAKVASTPSKPDRTDKKDAELKSEEAAPSLQRNTKMSGVASPSVTTKKHHEEKNVTKQSVAKASPSPENDKKKTIVRHQPKAAPNTTTKHQEQDTGKVDKVQIIDTKKKMLIRRQRT